MSRYRINLEDEAHLSRVLSWPFSWWGATILAVTGLLLAVTLAVVVIMNTSLKSHLPGYLPPQQREATIDDLMRVDSLTRRYEANEKYLENIMTILDTDRGGGDSLLYAEATVNTTTDSLMPTTRSEREFRAMMDERERYNLSILAPVAADRMLFEEPAPGYTFARGSEESRAARLVIPNSESVRSIADGSVVDIHFSPASGYTLTIQHTNGFLSRWSHLGLPLVTEGEAVTAGQPLAPTDRGNGRTGAYVSLRIWRNGTPLTPYTILRADRTLTPDAVVK